MLNAFEASIENGVRTFNNVINGLNIDTIDIKINRNNLQYRYRSISNRNKVSNIL